MKKSLIILGLIFGLFLSFGNSVFAVDTELVKLQTISKIGELTLDEKLDIALEMCNSALEKYPDEPDLYHWKAAIMGSMGNNEEAIKSYDKELEFRPNTSSIYVMRGVAKSELGDKEGALADYNYAIEINPQDISAYGMRAALYLERGQIQEANDDLTKANELHTNQIRNKK